mmetsp:Transcript_24267/g.33249  ORF Transcript_24267/g.33249 Transcript_24267/m.33249 type:complete len:214 (+) Transcript_24267:1059-1700(+)
MGSIVSLHEPCSPRHWFSSVTSEALSTSPFRSLSSFIFGHAMQPAVQVTCALWKTKSRLLHKKCTGCCTSSSLVENSANSSSVTSTKSFGMLTRSPPSTALMASSASALLMSPSPSLSAISKAASSCSMLIRSGDAALSSSGIFWRRPAIAVSLDRRFMATLAMSSTPVPTEELWSLSLRSFVSAAVACALRSLSTKLLREFTNLASIWTVLR